MAEGIVIRIDTLGEATIQRTMVRRLEVLADMRPAWEAIADDFAAWEHEWFASRGGSTWVPLSPRYAYWKSRKYPGMPIMRREDDLYLSLTQRPFGIENINADSMEIGTDVHYAQYHQRGGADLPQRKVIDIDEETKRRWIKIIQRYLVEGDRSMNGTPAWGPPGGAL